MTPWETLALAEAYRDGQRLPAAQATATIAIASMLSGKPPAIFLPAGMPSIERPPEGKLDVAQLKAALVDFTVQMGGTPPAT